MFLALEMGMPLWQLLQIMPSSELAEWSAYFELKERERDEGNVSPMSAVAFREKRRGIMRLAGTENQGS